MKNKESLSDYLKFLLTLFLFLSPLLFLTIGNLYLLLNINDENEDKKEHILIHYKDGKSIYCEGDTDAKWQHRFGEWKFYYPSGTILQKILYNNDNEIIKIQEFNEGGILIFEVIESENNNQRNKFYEDGVQKSKRIETYKNDYTIAVINTYYRSGKIKEQYFEKDEKIDGLFSMWDENGKLILNLEYDSDKIILKNENDSPPPHLAK